MTLTLTIRNVASLDNGVPTEFVLHRRGAGIGRAATCDWALPDPHRYISSRHCEITFRDDCYFLSDVSTNGTFINGATERISGERRLEPGDLITIGHYEVVASLGGDALAALNPAVPAESARSVSWDSWNEDGESGTGATAAGPPGSGGWASPRLPTAAPNSLGEAPGGSVPAVEDQFRWGSTPASNARLGDSGGWAPDHDSGRLPSGHGSMWQAEEAAPAPASGWSSAVPDKPAGPSMDDIWGRIAEGNVVDWARGGFGAPAQPAMSDPLGLDEGSPTASFPAPSRPSVTAAPSSGAEASRGRSAPPARSGSGKVAAAGPPDSATAATGSGGNLDQVLADFLNAAGVDPTRVKGAPPEVLLRGSGLLRRLVAGIVVLVEARARAKAQMGAESTRLEFNGNNPIKFARTPEEALAQLLSTPERGFMDSNQAIEDAFLDLQSHQMATLTAMQGALRATLDRFSPQAIRERVGDESLLKKLVPAARDAALWQSYEKEFGGVAHGSDEAFMDVFAKEFRKAYEEQATRRH